MILYPAMDFYNGRCVRLKKGKQGTEEFFDEDMTPVERAKEWEAMGAKALHLVDLNGAFSGDGKNMKIIREIRQAVQLPINLGGGIRTVQQAEQLIGEGFQTILGTMLIKDRKMAEGLAARYGDSVVAAIDCFQDSVTSEGWVTKSSLQSAFFIESLKESGFKSFLYTDIEKDGTLGGPSFDSLERLTSIEGIRLIASGGVGTIEDLVRLRKMGIYGVVAGKALLSGRISLKEALEVC